MKTSTIVFIFIGLAALGIVIYMLLGNNGNSDGKLPTLPGIAPPQQTTPPPVPANLQNIGLPDLVTNLN